MNRKQLPLMPLKSVLFPGMPMPLFIFEPRYRQMIEHCLAGEKMFGVTWLAAAPETGELRGPCAVGTTATIVRTEEIKEGGLHVLTVGTQRFRLHEIVRQEPYWVGELELLPEAEAANVPGELQAELRELFRDYLRLLLRALGQPEVAFEISVPEDAVRLSYMVAAHLTCPTVLRQRVLELDDLEQRLRYERQLLLRESEEYRLLLAARRRSETAGGDQERKIFSRN